VFVIDEVVALNGNVTYTATLLSVDGRYAAIEMSSGSS
jgi:hypothetical protein